mmetsp:Transcript_15624/g.33775  ORF Transcript_15624/g.33775 Transcript_15624/m.33775 type:complete len:307 (+) Transcript_15624:1182-2102(+)
MIDSMRSRGEKSRVQQRHQQQLQQQAANVAQSIRKSSSSKKKKALLPPPPRQATSVHHHGYPTAPPTPTPPTLPAAAPMTGSAGTTTPSSSPRFPRLPSTRPILIIAGRPLLPPPVPLVVVGLMMMTTGEATKIETRSRHRVRLPRRTALKKENRTSKVASTEWGSISPRSHLTARTTTPRVMMILTRRGPGTASLITPEPGQWQVLSFVPSNRRRKERRCKSKIEINNNSSSAGTVHLQRCSGWNSPICWLLLLDRRPDHHHHVIPTAGTCTEDLHQLDRRTGNTVSTTLPPRLPIHHEIVIGIR